MRVKAKSQSRRGTALIEGALVLLLFLILIFGILDWSWAFFQQQTIMSNTSDAARWAAAHRADAATLTQVQNIVLCGSPSCSGSATGLYQDATIEMDRLSRQDVIDATMSPPMTVTRNYVRVRVSGYRMMFFGPTFYGNRTGKTIEAIQPMECQRSDFDCTIWN